MGKKLAIRGHSTRGKEVIELLEMMGGKNIHKRDGEANAYSYYLYDNAILSDRLSIAEDDDFEIFTLQDFLEKFPYKVGDKVHIYVQNDDIDGRLDTEVAEIISMRWNPDIRKIAYKMKNINREFYKEEIKCKADDSNKPTNKKTDNIKLSDNKCERTHEDVIFDSIIWHLRNSVNSGKQHLSGGDCEAYFRELVKKVNENDMESCKCPEYEDIKKVAYLSINKKDYADEIEVNLGDDYEYKFEMNRLYILKKKPKYPTTYEECCKIKHCDTDFYVDTHLYSNTLGLLYKLLICRDAYWKIAGKELGLGKPWELKSTEMSHAIVCRDDGDFLLHRRTRAILIFPTKEMRDAFYENFKELIESCKELL